MELYTISQPCSSDVEKLILFIDIHWKKNHSLVLSRDLLNFQHYDKNNNKYNFFLAENNITGEVDAIIGFIPLYQYDIGLSENGDYWGAIWKIREDVKNEEINSIGYFLWKKLFKLPSFNSYAAIGISNVAKQIYEISRLKLGSLNQYYILREQDIPYKIAIAPLNNLNQIYKSRYIKKADIDEHTILEPFYRPYKSIKYLINRYKNHPLYKYSFLNVLDKVILVTRTIVINNTKVMRIIDCVGNLNSIPNLYNDLQFILSEEDAEYIDFINYGVDNNIFLNLGFKELNFDGDIIIPNYFEPFEQRNVKIEFAYKANYDNYTIFKGDSDQDRPNII